MKALVLREHGEAGLRLESGFPDPAPGEGDVVLRVRATSLNYHDVFTRRGMPGIKIPMPAIMGLDVAGEIAAIGPGVTGWNIGDRVLCDSINRVEGGLVGGGRLGWPKSVREDEQPPWLVFGAMIRTVTMTETEAGVHPLASALEEEGFGEIGAVEVTESFARHLMVAFDRWQADGFASLAHQYLGLLEREPQTRARTFSSTQYSAALLIPTLVSQILTRRESTV